jgi:hypothetical protein
MKILVPSAIALAMLLGVGSASACDFHQMTMASVAPEPAQPAASAKLQQMVMTYLREIADEHRIA